MLRRTVPTPGAAAAFHKHVHTANCPICSGCTPTVTALDVQREVSSPPGDKPASSSGTPRSTATRVELMTEGMRAWEKRFSIASRRELRQVAIPATVALPQNDSFLWPSLTCGAAASNVFLGRLLSTSNLSLGENGLAKQLLFQRTLLDFHEALSRVAGAQNFFLACGTALAAHREGYFIPHDDDIDVGIFYEDLVEIGLQGRSQDTWEESELSLAGSGLQRILSSLTVGDPQSDTAGSFLIFDVCGSVESGLEVRLMHIATGVRLDVNVYYTSQEPKIEKGRPFLWSATHYEEAEKRARGMYRYKHTPFRDRLESTPFCSRTDDGSVQFLRPPVTYLEEYFGVDWRTPKAYSYRDGLNGEYKNIIDE